MKKGIIAVAVILMMTLTSCGASLNHDVYTEIYNRYNAMKSFTATATVEVTGNKGNAVYKIKQYYTAPDKYRLDILEPEASAGTTYIFDGGNVYLKSDKGGSATLENYIPSEKDYMFVPQFFEDYYKSEDSFAEASKDLSGEQTKLNSVTDSGNVSRFSQSIWIDNKTFVPSRLATYDINGGEVIVVDFEEFTLNDKIDDTVYQK